MNQNILDFGAIADGITLNSTAIQSAIDACAATGGGRVTIPYGTFLSGTIWLKSHVELHLEKGAVLLASPNMDDYNELDAYPQNFSCAASEKWYGKHLIIAHECEDVAITGLGSINGNGDQYFGEPNFYAKSCWIYGLALAKDPVALRPGQLLCFIECKDVVVTDITCFNLTCWCCFLHGCENVTVRAIKVFSPKTYANTDGIDIDCCRYVTVSDCIIDTGDDAIAIRGSNSRLKHPEKVCEYITITNCVLSSASSVFRIGVGTGLIRHVRISNLTVPEGAILFTFMTSFDGHGHVSMEDIHISGVSATHIVSPLYLYTSNEAYIRNVSFENIYVETYIGSELTASLPDTISDITLRNFTCKIVPGHLTEEDYLERDDYIFYAHNVSGLTLDHFKIHVSDEHLRLRKGLMQMDACPDLEIRK